MNCCSFQCGTGKKNGATFWNLWWLPIVSLRSSAGWGWKLKKSANNNNLCFSIFMPSTWPEKAKLTVDFLAFPSVKLSKILQSGSKYFILVRTRFFREAYKTSVFAVVKGRHKFEKKSRKLPLQPLLFSCLKFVSRWKQCAVNILKDFIEGNSRKLQIKP